MKTASRRRKETLKELTPTSMDRDALNQLSEDFTWCVQRRDASIFRRLKKNFETRNCIWPGQSEDGKKWGKDAFPWKGAADSQVPLVDLYVNQDVAFLMVLERRGRVTVTPTDAAEDSAYATRMTQVLRWMKFTQMSEALHEKRLLANYFFERGGAVLGTFWERRTQLGYDTLDLETLTALSMDVQQAAQSHAGELNERDERVMLLPRWIMDPSKEADAASALGELYEDVKQSRLLKVVQDLRNEGTARFPRPYEVSNRPRIVALAPNEDIFLPPEAIDLQTASSIYRRELLTETQLREREHSHGWDAKWIAAMLDTQRGNITADFDQSQFRRRQYGSGGRVLETARLFEVVHGFRRLADDDGVPGIYNTVFNRGLVAEEICAKHELLDYDHGEQPFIYYQREVRSRLLDESRGYGEIAKTWQHEIKTQWDSRIDRAAISTLPPYYYPHGEAPDAWGPGVGVPTSRPNDYGFMETPKHDIGSEEAEQTVRDFADEYFNRSVHEAKQVQNGIGRQDLGNLWLSYNAQADTQCLQLMQQYMPDSFYFRVVGSNKGKPIHATREEIQGKFDVSISFNVDDLDGEKVKQKLDLIEKMYAMDMSGRVDRDEGLDLVADMIDPGIGERLLKDPQDASVAELDDEDTAFAKMFAGIPVDVKPSGQAYQLRLQRLQNILSLNKTAQERLQSDDQFREIVETRMKELQFQIQQKQVNPQIGRLGGTPANVQLGGGQQ